MSVIHPQIKFRVSNFRGYSVKYIKWKYNYILRCRYRPIVIVLLRIHKDFSQKVHKCELSLVVYFRVTYPMAPLFLLNSYCSFYCAVFDSKEKIACRHL
jgi:hypothetical protein